MSNTSKILSSLLILVLAVSSLIVIFVTVPFGTAESAVNINADGSVIGSTSIGQVNNNTYRFFADITGNIQIQASNIILDGGGYTLNGAVALTNAAGNDLTNPTSGVTIENLYIINGNIGVANGGNNNTFYDDYINSSLTEGDCINLMGNTSYNNITFCTLNGSNETDAIDMMLGPGNNTVTENNITGAVIIYLSEGGTVDHNYWSDYLTKYPDAKEVDSSGIGDQPYVFWIQENSTEIYYQDNHPLTQPVAIPLTSPTVTTSPTPTLAPTASISEFPSLIIFVAVIILAGSLTVLLNDKKHKKC